MSVQSVVDELQSRPGTGDVIHVINPVTEEQIAELLGMRRGSVKGHASRAAASLRERMEPWQ